MKGLHTASFRLFQIQDILVASQPYKLVRKKNKMKYKKHYFCHKKLGLFQNNTYFLANAELYSMSTNVMHVQFPCYCKKIYRLKKLRQSDDYNFSFPQNFAFFGQFFRFPGKSTKPFFINILVNSNQIFKS